MKFILDLLTEGYMLRADELYAVLNKSAKKLSSEDNRGLGKVFQAGTRNNYLGDANINNAFIIDDSVTDSKAKPKKPAARIKNINALYKLAQVFKKGDAQQKIDKNEQKYAICLAIIVNVMGNKVEPAIFQELSSLYAGVFANRKIKAKLAEKAKVLALPTTIVEKMLFDMSNKKVEGGLKANKEAQQKFFNEKLTTLSLEQLTTLLEYMGKVQDMKLGQDPYFMSIRQERFSLFGGGNTTTWQNMFTAAKAQLLVKLGAPAPSSKEAKEPVKKEAIKELSAVKFKALDGLLSQQSGRWYATLFATNSSTFFNTRFKAAAEVPVPAPQPSPHKLVK